MIELENTLSTERSLNGSARDDLKHCQEGIGVLKNKIAELEYINLQLSQRANQLESDLSEGEAKFHSKVKITLNLQ